MYRVVLIDDEAIILEGLKKVVDWTGYGCQVVATARNAAEGAAVIHAQQPDIVFSDIKMPDCDGLTMLAGLKSEFPNMEITVLTGYRDFAYAQQAVRLGVTRLLLKPSKMDEINEAMLAMVANLNARQQGSSAPEVSEPNVLEQEASTPDEKPAVRFLVRAALGYMQTHSSEKLALQEVADHCYVSQWHLSKLLNKNTGKSFYNLLNEIRIEEAKTLLSDPSLKIGEIGERVGYSDPGHFARTFRRLTGMSANEYRNQTQNT